MGLDLTWQAVGMQWTWGCFLLTVGCSEGPNATGVLVGGAVAMRTYLFGLSLPSTDANNLPGEAETSC